MAYKKTTTTTIRKKKIVRRSTNIAKVVKRVLQRNLETKVCSRELSFTLFNSAITSTGEIFQLLPQVVKGLNQNERVGDSITPKRLEVMGIISYNANTQQPAEAILARLFAFQDKHYRSYDAQANVSMNLIDFGGSPTLYDGTLIRSIAPVNKDRYNWYLNKSYKFMKPVGFTNLIANGVTAPFNSCRMFKLVFTQKRMPAKLTYSTGNNNPDTFAPYMALGYAYQQNNAPDVTDTQIGMSFVSTLYYNDA